jgi:hypothetical protein
MKLDTFFFEIADDSECIFCSSDNVVLLSNCDTSICEDCGLWQVQNEEIKP